MGCVSFKLFWPLALVQQAQAAIVFVVRGLCGQFRFCVLGLTRRSSRPAYCGRLILFVSPITRFMRAATYFSARPCSKGLSVFLASSACQPSTTSYHSCSAAPLPWPSAFSWAAHVFKAGRSLLAFGSNSAVKRTASPPLTLAVRQRNGKPGTLQAESLRREETRTFGK